MNKYLEKYNEIVKQLETKDDFGYAVLIKSLIAREFEWRCGDRLNFTDEQMEEIINITYDEYVDIDADVSPYNVSNAMRKVLLQCKTFDVFKAYYDNRFEDFRDDFLEGLE